MPPAFTPAVDAPPGIAVREPLRAYCASVMDLGAGRITAQALLVAAGALVEGFGILLLVPLLTVVFGEAGGPNGRTGALARAFLAGFEEGFRLLLLLGLFMVLMALRGLILWRRDMGLARLSAEVIDQWRERLIGALAGAGWPRLQALHQSHVEFALTADVGRLAIGSQQLLRGATAVIQLGVAGVLIMMLSPWLAMCAALLLLPAALIGQHLARATLRLGAELTTRGGRRHDALRAFLGGLKLAKAHHAERFYAAEFIRQSDELRSSALAFNDRQLRAANLYPVLAAALASLLLIVGRNLLHVAPALLPALLVLIARMAGPVMQLGQGAQQVLVMLPAVSNLTALEGTLAEAAESVPAPPAEQREKGPARLTLSGLGYRYPGAAEEVLRDVDGEIGAGEFVALIGPSGSGKTTLADILIGLAAPQRGQVLVDGRPLGEAARTAWRRQIGYVPQDPFLFDRSLAENLRWAVPEATDAELWTALSAAEADDFVRSLPDGLDTRAGERGGRFSGGERQRLCLARALLRLPRLLLLDEATNTLDAATEGRLLATLAGLKGRTTIVMITHRPPESMPVDRVLRLSCGRL